MYAYFARQFGVGVLVIKLWCSGSPSDSTGMARCVVLLPFAFFQFLAGNETIDGGLHRED